MSGLEEVDGLKIGDVIVQGLNFLFAGSLAVGEGLPHHLSVEVHRGILELYSTRYFG
jgi:hypothetical protein